MWSCLPGRQTELKRWRTERTEGTAEMSDLAITMNEALGTILDEQTRRLIRRKGWYVSSKDVVIVKLELVV